MTQLGFYCIHLLWSNSNKIVDFVDECPRSIVNAPFNAIRRQKRNKSEQNAEFGFFIYLLCNFPPGRSQIDHHRDLIAISVRGNEKTRVRIESLEEKKKGKKTDSFQRNTPQCQGYSTQNWTLVKRNKDYTWCQTRFTKFDDFGCN